MTDTPATFAEWLQSHAGGRTDDELAAGLRDLLDECILHDKTGKLTVTFSVEPKGDGVLISAEVGVKPPKVPATPSFYFKGDDGMPSRRDPNQPELPLDSKEGNAS